MLVGEECMEGGLCFVLDGFLLYLCCYNHNGMNSYKIKLWYLWISSDFS